MKFRFTPRARSQKPPAWIFIGLGLGTAGFVFWFLSFIPEKYWPPCGFHLVTGHPCPTCGATRAAVDMIHGRWLEALQTNPFFSIVIWTLLAWVAVGGVTWLAGRNFTIQVSPHEEKWWWLLLLAAFLINWAYMWVVGI